MSSKNQSERIIETVIGLEFDTCSIRAVKISINTSGNFNIDKAEMLKGNYTKKEKFAEDMRHICTLFNIQSHRLITHLSGKHVYGAQITFKKPDGVSLKNALRFHLRKSIPFETLNGHLEYQILKKAQGEDALSQILVSAASKGVLEKHLKELSPFGLTPDTIDILPVSIANALKLFYKIPLSGKTGPHSSDAPAHSSPIVGLHMGEGICSLVIEGEECVFYHRSIYFNAKELFEQLSTPTHNRERERKLRNFGDEIARTLSFYEKNHPTNGFKTICLLGEYIEEPELETILNNSTGLEIQRMNLASFSIKNNPSIPVSRFDLAITLALKGANSETYKKFLYTTDMIRQRKVEYKKVRSERLKRIATGTFCFGFLLLAMFYTTLKIIDMENILKNEREKLANLEVQYKKYKTTKLIVEKDDVELLDSLQHSRIFWTRKLASKAMHLPENYWITEFGFAKNELDVKGFGYISSKQRQLIRLNEYLDKLRADSNFKDKFKKTYFDLTERNDEGWRQRVEFEYSALTNLKSGTFNKQLPRTRRQRRR